MGSLSGSHIGRGSDRIAVALVLIPLRCDGVGVASVGKVPDGNTMLSQPPF